MLASYVLQEASFPKGLSLGQFGQELRVLFPAASISVTLMSGAVTVSADVEVDEAALAKAVLLHLPSPTVDPLVALKAKRALNQELTLSELQKIADIVLSEGS